MDEKTPVLRVFFVCVVLRGGIVRRLFKLDFLGCRIDVLLAAFLFHNIIYGFGRRCGWLGWRFALFGA